ncbi:MAG: hypothetical protein D6758_06900 [Gammaproteobacteria bacterium]|nr:MAG: hypothetical protein D6758_06900 [Gammaproteobacteria bacterium]
MGAFFLYPLKRDPIILILICTLVPAVLSSGLLALAVSLLLLGAQTRYLFAVIEHTADGHLEPPALGTAFSGGGLILVIQQVVIFVLLGVAVQVITAYAGWFAGMLSLLVVVLALPAIILLLAIEGQIGDALNPLRWLGLIAALGWPYFVLFGYLVLLFLGAGIVTDFMWQHFSPSAAQALMGMSASYFSIVAFHLMGYLLYQYQDRLGFAADGDDAEVVAQGPRSDAETLTDVDVRLREGDFMAAAAALAGYVERHRTDGLQIERLFRILQESRDEQALRKYARLFMEYFLSAGQGDSLIALLNRIREQDPAWQPANAELAFQAAEVAYQQGDIRLALWLLKDFHKRYAQDAMVVADALILSARILANHLKNPQKAAAFLKTVQARFPMREEKAAQLLERLSRHGVLADGL